MTLSYICNVLSRRPQSSKRVFCKLYYRCKHERNLSHKSASNVCHGNTLSIHYSNQAYHLSQGYLSQAVIRTSTVKVGVFIFRARLDSKYRKYCYIRWFPYLMSIISANCVFSCKLTRLVYTNN